MEKSDIKKVTSGNQVWIGMVAEKEDGRIFLKPSLSRNDIGQMVGSVLTEKGPEAQTSINAEIDALEGDDAVANWVREKGLNPDDENQIGLAIVREAFRRGTNGITMIGMLEEKGGEAEILFGADAVVSIESVDVDGYVRSTIDMLATRALASTI